MQGRSRCWNMQFPPLFYLLTYICCLFQYIHHSPGNSKRGFGIDCAILSCQVYISQILVASALGSVVDAVGTVRVIPMVASVGSFLGFLTATFLVIYPEVNEEPKEEQKGLGPPETTEGNSTGAEKPTVLKLTRKGTTTSELEGESAVWGRRLLLTHIPGSAGAGSRTLLLFFFSGKQIKIFTTCS